MTHGNYDHEEQDSQEFQDEYKLWRKLESIDNGLKELQSMVDDFVGKKFSPTNAPYPVGRSGSCAMSDTQKIIG